MEITMPHKEKASEMKHYAGKAVFSAAIGHALDGLDLMIFELRALRHHRHLRR